MIGKRIFDLVLALLMIIPAMVIVMLCAAVIWAECRANPIFSQQRLGRRKQPFTLYKLRTMQPGTRQGMSHEVGGATILRCGALLRRLKLDELPQLWNILRGEMSFVGPRPGMAFDERLTIARDSNGVFELVPGIAGVGQLAGLDMSTPELLAQQDARYCGPWSPATDIAILAKTLGGKGFRDASLGN